MNKSFLKTLCSALIISILFSPILPCRFVYSEAEATNPCVKLVSPYYAPKSVTSQFLVFCSKVSFSLDVLGRIIPLPCKAIPYLSIFYQRPLENADDASGPLIMRSYDNGFYLVQQILPHYSPQGYTCDASRYQFCTSKIEEDETLCENINLENKIYSEPSRAIGLQTILQKSYSTKLNKLLMNSSQMGLFTDSISEKMDAAQIEYCKSLWKDYLNHFEYMFAKEEQLAKNNPGFATCNNINSDQDESNFCQEEWYGNNSVILATKSEEINVGTNNSHIRFGHYKEYRSLKLAIKLLSDKMEEALAIEFIKKLVVDSITKVADLMTIRDRYVGIITIADKQFYYTAQYIPLDDGFINIGRITTKPIPGAPLEVITRWNVLYPTP